MKKYLDTMPESLEAKITQIFGETVAKEGNKFSAALMAARENGKKFFSVNGKQFKTEDYKEGFGANTPSNPTAGVKTVRQAQAARRASGGTTTNPGQMRPVKRPMSNDTTSEMMMKDKMKKEDNTNNKSDDGKGLDKVQPKAVKKKFDDRKDKDIDNDGDVDSSDKYLHTRRKAISKAIKKEWAEADGSLRRVAEGDKRKMKERVVLQKGSPASAPAKPVAKPMKMGEEKKSIVDIQQEKNQSMREMLAKIWGVDEGKSPFQPEMKMKKEMMKKGMKTETGEKATKVEVNPELQQPGSTVVTPDR